LNLESEIVKCMGSLGFPTLLNRASIHKEKGYAPINVLFVLILLPFTHAISYHLTLSPYVR
jgi:hypothetical protein